MTPLAYSIWKEKWSKRAWRRCDDKFDVMQRFDDFHCFDVTAVNDLANQLQEDWYCGKGSAPRELTFLPAPRTWIEYQSAHKISDNVRRQTGDYYRGVETITSRQGWFLEEADDRASANVTLVLQGKKTWSSVSKFIIPLLNPSGSIVAIKSLPRAEPEKRDEADVNKVSVENIGEFLELSRKLDDIGRRDRELLTEIDEVLSFQRSKEFIEAEALLIFAHLIMINSPKVIGRRQHAPRKLAQIKMAGGAFPLHAWTEIVLEVSKPADIDDGEPHKATITGARALHFCRAHVRIKNGRLEYVKAHWRGDPSIGIVRSRYSVQP